ncbi:MAG: hypothetical protein K6E51_13415 [Treponema sp.]|nr:hypothetical protein [Treponema sp.]
MMRKYVICVLLLLFCFPFFALEINQSFFLLAGPNRQTGFKRTEMNFSTIYSLDARYFSIMSGVSYDAETLHVTLELLATYHFITPYVSLGVGGGGLYHNLWFYDVMFEQDYGFLAKGYIGSSLTDTKIGCTFCYGEKRSKIFAVQDYFPVFKDQLVNYDFWILQHIIRSYWKLGYATYSVFRYDLRFIPEVYLKVRYDTIQDFSFLGSIQVVFSDMSNKTCHPEYLFAKVGLAWFF